MRNTLFLLAACAMAGANLSAQATIYGDATGDVFTGAGGGILDITSVEVTTTGSDMNFKINLAGDPVGTDWGKYLIGIHTGAGGDTVGNGWGRPISLSTGMNYWIGNWADSGNGEQLYQYTGAWNQINAWGNFAGPGATAQFDAGFGVTKGLNFVNVQVPFAALGLGPTSTFSFDVYTAGGGGGDGAIDSLANPSQTISDWGNAYSSGLSVSYTVPEPTALALLGLGGLVLGQRSFRRRN